MVNLSPLPLFLSSSSHSLCLQESTSHRHRPVETLSKHIIRSGVSLFIMAANEYYNPTSRRNQTPQPTYQSYNSQQPPLTSLPSYHSQPPSQAPSAISPVSPFEAPFDDNVYPMGAFGQHRLDSQSTLGADSRYYGQGGGGRQGSTTSFRDDIPLRDHPGAPRPKGNMDGNDHVYDAGDPTVPPHLMEEARPKRRSKLDFITPQKGKRIPWVTYILTTAQVAVFIAEITKNGMCLRRANLSKHNTDFL